MKKSLLETIDVKKPCTESWDEMTGNDQVRFCSHCSKDVHNLSSMTRARAEKLVRDSNGRLCVRYIKGPNGGIVTAPAGLTQIKRQAAVAAGVLAASLTLSTFAYSQSEPVPTPINGKAVVKHASEKNPDTPGSISISGVVHDIHGAVVPGARIALTKTKTDAIRSTESNDEGRFEFKNVEPGNYELEVASPGFMKLIVQDLHVTDSVDLTTELTVNAEVVGDMMIDISGLTVESAEPEISTQVQMRPLNPRPPTAKQITMGLVAPTYTLPADRPKKNKKKLPK